MSMGDAMVVAWLLVAGQPAVPQATVAECKAAEATARGAGFQASCISAVAVREAMMVSQIAAMRETSERDEARWANRDRAWCMKVRHMGVDPGDSMYWPDLRACRADDPPCDFRPARPPACP